MTFFTGSNPQLSCTYLQDLYDGALFGTCQLLSSLKIDFSPAIRTFTEHIPEVASTQCLQQSFSENICKFRRKTTTEAFFFSVKLEVFKFNLIRKGHHCFCFPKIFGKVFRASILCSTPGQLFLNFAILEATSLRYSREDGVFLHHIYQYDQLET